MTLAQPVARFVQRHCLNVNIPVDSPDEAVIVEDLAESDVELVVVINICRGAGCGVNENEREGGADDVGGKHAGGKPAGMSDVGEEERPPGLAEKRFDYSYIKSGNVRQFGDWDGRAILPVPCRHRPINRRGRLRDRQAVNRALSLIDEVGDVRATASARIARHEMCAQLFGAVIEKDRLPDLPCIIRSDVLNGRKSINGVAGLQLEVSAAQLSRDLLAG